VVDTPAWDGRPDRASFYEGAAKGNLVNRVGTVDDLASAYFFLATNGFVSGVVLDVDGGLRDRV